MNKLKKRKIAKIYYKMRHKYKKNKNLFKENQVKK